MEFAAQLMMLWLFKKHIKLPHPVELSVIISKHPVLSATSAVACAHLLMHRKQEVAPVINGRVL